MSDTIENLEEVSFKIILHAGNARSSAMKAISLAKEYKFKEAGAELEEAESETTKAHHEQTKLLKNEADGKKNDISVILIHAQDHLMTSMTVKDLAREIIDMHRKMQILEGES